MLDRDYVHRAEDAYVECAMWADEPEEDFIGLHADADIALRADMAAFLTDETVCRLIARHALTAERVGHDFWLTRNRHGAGFWDRGLGTIGDELTKAAHAWGESSLYVGDDGWVYLD